ncbi:MAG TPA: hypothetical protein VN026_12185 [Bacteroidia bacterium]|nr:hypothetical protein [Bacteroidia bacterium]
MKKFILILIALNLFIGCKKKKTDDNQANTIPPTVLPAQAPVFSFNIPADANGVLIASQIPHEFTNLYVTQLGGASAFFYTAPGNYSYVDAGTVTCNDSILVKQSSGSYYFGGKAINGQPFSGINYGSGSSWTVTGSTSVPSFTFANTSFPTTAALTSSTLISKTNPYAATYSGAANADSVVVMLSGDSTNLQKKTVVATAGVCNFSAAEIGAVKKHGSTNNPFINFVSYRIQVNTVSIKKYYMVNSMSSSYMVNIY